MRTCMHVIGPMHARRLRARINLSLCAQPMRPVAAKAMPAVTSQGTCMHVLNQAGLEGYLYKSKTERSLF